MHDRKIVELNQLNQLKDQEKETQKINFLNNKASIIEDFEKKLQAQTESHEQKLNELG